MCDVECHVLLAQYIALLCALLAWFAYRVERKANQQPRFRIERVTFYDTNRVVYYCVRRGPLNTWNVFEIEKGVRGYNSEQEAKTAMEGYFNKLGLELTETKVVQTYG